MQQGQRTIVWFNEVAKKDIPIAGGKGVSIQFQ